MIEKLDFLVRFWELKARNASLGEPLHAREQIELLSLMQLVTGDLDAPSAGPVDRPKGALPAQMIGDGTILPVEIRNVTAAAVIVSCASIVPVGAQVILRAADAISGVEYALPCKVHLGLPGCADHRCPRGRRNPDARRLRRHSGASNVDAARAREARTHDRLSSLGIVRFAVSHTWIGVV